MRRRGDAKVSPAGGVPVLNGPIHVVAVTVGRSPLPAGVAAGLHQLPDRHWNETQFTWNDGEVSWKGTVNLRHRTTPAAKSCQHG